MPTSAREARSVGRARDPSPAERTRRPSGVRVPLQPPAAVDPKGGHGSIRRYRFLIGGSRRRSTRALVAGSCAAQAAHDCASARGGCGRSPRLRRRPRRCTDRRPGARDPRLLARPDGVRRCAGGSLARDETGGHHRRADRARQPARAARGPRRRARGRRRARAPVVLALFDLNGFKHYNDTFGHPAGDALLVRLGAQPRPTPSAAGGARLPAGGDEFCVALAPATPRAVRSSAAAALRSPRRATASRSRCAFGVVAAARRRRDDVERGAALADQRMYAQKQAGRASPARQSSDVLLRALAERDPDLARAQRRASPSSPRGRRAARPQRARSSSSCASRPSCTTSARSRSPTRSSPSRAPLDDERVGAHAPHTLIGERIVAAAPALRRGRRARALHARALGRRRLPGRPRRRGDPARRADHRGLRRVRRDDLARGRTGGAIDAEQALAELARCAARSSIRPSSRRSRRCWSTGRWHRTASGPPALRPASRDCLRSRAFVACSR